MEEPLTGTEFEDLGRKFDFYGDTPVTISAVLVPNERIAKEVFYFPAAFLLVLVVFLQLRRRKSGGGAAAAPA